MSQHTFAAISQLRTQVPVPILDLRLLTEGTEGRQGLQKSIFRREDLNKNFFFIISSFLLLSAISN